MNFIYFTLLLLVVFSFMVWAVIVRSKFQPGKEIRYRYRGQIMTGRIEYVGETCIMVNNLYIKKSDVL